MSPISRIGLFAISQATRVCTRTTPLTICKRSCGWIRDYKPGPYPRTQEEREAAARKYNLIPEDYKPFPEDSGYGDYPDMPPVGQDARDPYEDFDYYSRRRNFGETLHIDYDTHMSEKNNPNVQYRYTKLQMLGSFLGFVSIFVVAQIIDMYFDLSTQPPTKPKQYPKPGVVHYSFEPLDN